LKEVKKIIKLAMSQSFSWVTLLIASLGAIFFYVLMEWLFIVTMPSFLSLVPFSEKMGVLFGTSSLFSTVFLCLLLMGVILIKILPGSAGRYLKLASVLIPAVVLASSGLLLIDNFTYTLFSFGIVTSRGCQRLLYGLLFLVMIFVFWVELVEFIFAKDRNITKYFTRHKWVGIVLICGIVLTSIFLLLSGFEKLPTNELTNSGKKDNRLPNILLVTIDSLNADHMSLYGYKRDTTPFLSTLSEESLLALNSFSNVQGTSGSITSILTGKYPTDTRVITASDILRGEDSYQHLPGILESYGYYTVQLSFSQYADAYDLNFMNAFDEANGNYERNSGTILWIKQVLPSNYAYFIYEIGNRLMDRVNHIYFIKDMENPYDQVTKSMELINDQEKLDRIISLLDSTDQPLFIHLHWMGTHGPKFFPEEQVFSTGKVLETQEKYDLDLYDDSILEFDESMAKLYAALTERNLEDNTLIVFTADHSLRWTKSRLPLMIKFPSSAYTGTIMGNTQNLDIAPTILDYLDIPIPEWMAGESLLGEIEIDRPIFLSVVDQTKTEDDFFQFGKIAVIVCDDWYEVNLKQLEMTSGSVKNYQGNCPDIEFGGEEALRLLISHLQQAGFDTTSLDDVQIP
jgi:glucan phosphoethanolaminetransferase (alkaline phosphatase superfamily)